MRLDGPLSYQWGLAQRSQMRSLQSALSEAQREMATGRHADVNATLGLNTARNIDWRVSIDRFSRLKSTLGLSTARAETTQSALESVKTTLSGLMSTLVGARGASNGQALMHSAATQAMKSIREALNSSFNGEYVFGGLNTLQQPIGAYEGSTGQAAFDAAFQAEFGMAKDDPAAITITPSALQTFLQTTYEALFQPPAWNGTWTSASAENVLTRLAPDQQADLGANATEEPLRDVFASLTALAETTSGNMNQAAFETVADHALSKMAAAIRGIGDMQSRIGIGQAEVSQVQQSIDRKSALLMGQVGETEGIDPYEAALRVNSLSTQLETSFAMTGRLSKLSLINFI